jgi:hypothetical protein
MSAERSQERLKFVDAGRPETKRVRTDQQRRACYLESRFQRTLAVR